MGALAVLATYPVLPEARDWLRSDGPKLDVLLTDFLYARARDKARSQLWAALDDGTKRKRNENGEAGTPDTTDQPSAEPAFTPGMIAPGVDDPVGLAAARMAQAELRDDVMLSEIDEEMELVARPLARMLVAAIGHDLVRRRFAVHESKRLSKALERDPGETVASVARALDVPFRRDADDAGRFGLHFTDYLTLAPNEKKWRLPFRDLDAGVIWLDKEDTARLVEEVYKRYLEDELKGREGAVPGQVLEVFASDITRAKQVAERRAARYREQQFTEVDEARFPPCMKRILNDMANHVNVPHMGRFAIVTFLHTLGLDSDGILRFFSRLPDFSVEKSRYQIEHITGKGGPTEYTPPSCATMQTHGVCPLDERDETCARVKHPLGYYRREMWWKEKQAARRRGSNTAADNNGAPNPASNKVQPPADSSTVAAEGGSA